MKPLGGSDTLSWSNYLQSITETLFVLLLLFWHDCMTVLSEASWLHDPDCPIRVAAEEQM